MLKRATCTRRGLYLSEQEIIRRLNEELGRGRTAVLCTLYFKEGSGPRDPGAKMLVTNEGEIIGTIGGGGMERLLVSRAFEVMKDGNPHSYHFAMGIPAREGMIPVDSKCGGEVKIFMDPIKPDPRLVIMGSGLIAQVVARYAKDCGFTVIIIDDAKTATEENFPKITVINSKYPESLQSVKIMPSDYVAVLHGETDFETNGLRSAVKANPAYIGLLGSRNKRNEHVKQLKEEDLDFNVVEKIKGPIGLDIGAETPEEIGISILAELIQQKQG
jgi:xanthine dehydrogenase accessory factor